MTFIGASPLFFLSPFGGWLADRCDKRLVLIVCQLVFAITALFLAAAVSFGFVSFALIAALAFVNGVTAVIEIPTRQSLISNIVPPEELANALPINSATFNSARIIGPVVAAILLGAFGPAACYLVNGLSFAAIIFAVLAIKSNLDSTGENSASLKESLFDGIRHVFRTPAFRVIVSMMMTTAVFGLFYFSLLAAYTKSVLHLNKAGLGWLMTATGIGAMSGVFALIFLSHKPIKGSIPAVSMTGLGLSLFALSFVNTAPVAFLCLLFTGFFSICQMVGTNTALQYFSPPELRGRIVSVHVWSLAGLSPLGALAFGAISEKFSLSISFAIGGGVVFLVGLLVLLFASSIRNLR